MIDLHCHLLPALDDGAASLEEAMAMARMARAEGIEGVFCTPHWRPGVYDTATAEVASAVDSLQARLDAEGIGIALRAGMEWHFDIDLIARARAQRLPGIGQWNGEQAILLEFPHGELPAHAERLTGKLRELGIRPIIVHPERNAGFLARPQALSVFRDQGCLFQITAGALDGDFGEQPFLAAQRHLINGDAHFLATDAHNMTRRPPRLYRSYCQAARLVGEESANALVDGNPRALWR
ncbi:CpsB/CapC family capsule biosynthesis tyrosine phosphatase [Spiribacter sp. 221]|uniref:tyrosine-protein phosphatase n=1 Tax=Spiribacter onubensis TaxID=3122420 RepID=UPI00349F41CB